MTEEIETLHIKILNQELKIRCPEKDIPALQEAVNYITDKITSVKREKEAVASIDSIALITALNVAHELITERKVKRVSEDVCTRINTLRNKILETLAKRDLTVV